MRELKVTDASVAYPKLAPDDVRRSLLPLLRRPDALKILNLGMRNRLHLHRSSPDLIRRLFAWLCLASVLALLAHRSFAQAQYRVNVWSADDGLPQNVVRGIAQTPDGYLWIATFDGIARFDGLRFDIFNKSNTPGINTNRFSGMYAAPNGDLWLSVEGNGLTQYHQGVFHSFDINAAAIAGDDAGHVWILSQGNIYEWNKASGRFTASHVPKPNLSYRAFRWGQMGFWAVDKDQLNCFIRGHLVNYSLPFEVKAESIWGVYIDQNGAAWLETMDGKHARLIAGEPPHSLLSLSTPVSETFTDHEGHSWTFRIGRRLTRYVEYLSSGHSAELSFSEIYEDREKNLWLGTEGEGIFQLERQSIQGFTKEQGLVDRNVYPIFQDHSGAVWIGAWISGLSRFANGTFKNYTTANGLLNGLATAIWEDRNNQIWVGTRGGLALFKGGRFHRPSGFSVLDTVIVQAIYQDRHAVLWFGTTDGLFVYDNGNLQRFTSHNGLAADDVRSFVEDKQGDLWIGGYGGLTRFHKGKFTHWTEHDGLPSNNIRSLLEDSAGTLWIGTYDGGLGRFKDGRFTRFTMKDGLFNNGVFQILEDVHGNFWISCNRGIYRVSKQELNEFAEGKRSTVTSMAYGKADGMLNAECNGGVWPAGIKTADGKLWFPTQNGVAVVDPNAVRYNPIPPPVVIESLTADRQGLPVSDVARIPSDKENLEIQYTALSFINPKEIHFKYRLEGLDSKWVDAGTRRIADYSHLPPGRYRFHVIAENSDGVWNTDGGTLAITVLAPFYRTWGFLTFVLIMCVALAAIAWNWRISSLQRIQLAQQAFSQQLISSQESERKRIAVDLHDSIGQRLVVIQNLALFFLDSENKEDTQPIHEITTEAVSAIEEAREISYNLRPIQLDRLGLTKALESVARTVSRASALPILTDIDNIDNVFSEEIRINLYRIVQESLNNVVKHAHATKASISIRRTSGRVLMTVSDNGSGFMADAHHSGKGGLGLTGMSERAHLLGGELEVRSTPGHGTIVVVDIPLRGGTENA
jgi:signal transduction histidine kinase/ligand-binding sensor domain-containing protein